MVQQLTIAYECINAIGNSLKLEEMLHDVLSTFVRVTGAVGGKYILTLPHIQSIVSVGIDFDVPKVPTQNTQSFEIFTLKNGSFILNIPIREEHFLFIFKDKQDLKMLGNMFSNFRIKLMNAIDACRSVEKLHAINKNLKHQVSEEKNKNILNEKVMINQSKMAIMGEMIGMIAHQWRQPITVIGMTTNNIIIDFQMGEFSKKRTLNDLNLIDKQIHYLSQTIDDFRNFFKPHKLPIKFTLREIQHELDIILGKSFQTNKISLTFTGDLKTEICTHKNELLQVFLNILTNAKDAFVEKMVKKPQIEFNSHVEEDTIYFSIKDNAGGIPQEYIEKIFDPYFSTKDEKQGTGLGLYMSAIIIEKHLNGSIKVDSASPMTTFSIKIKQSGDTNNVY